MKVWIAAQPISNRRFSLQIGDKIPPLYTSREAISQIKKLHGEDSVAEADDTPALELQTQGVIIQVLQQKMATFEAELRTLKNGD